MKNPEYCFTMDGDEFDPILPAGIHCMTLEEFRFKFVDQFSYSTRRRLIFDKFSQFLDKVLSVKFVTELWLNGSFITEKPEPGDIDVVAFYDESKSNRLDDSFRDFLRDIEFIQLNFLTDIRFSSNNENWKSYWRGWYGFSRDQKPKGFVRLKLEI
jgi:hypothetical protein